MPTPYKPALTITDQIQLLKTRGLKLNSADEARMAALLLDNSFSRLAEYWRHFETDPVSHQFAPGTTMAMITGAYQFDVRLRQIVAEGLAVFEVASIQAGLSDIHHNRPVPLS